MSTRAGLIGLLSGSIALGSGCLLLAPSDDELVGVKPDAPAESGLDGYAKEVLLDAPIAWYRCDEAAGATQAEDSNGSSVTNPAVASPTGVTFGGPGLVRGSKASISLDNGHLDVGAVFQFLGQQPFTIEAWVRSDLLDPSSRYIATSEDPGGVGSAYKFFHNNTTLEFERIADATTVSGVYGPSAFEQGAITHVVAVYTGSQLELYQNGERLDQKATTISLNANTAKFRWGGRTSEQIASHFVGALDELAVYDKALSQERIGAHYNAGKL